MQTLNLCTKVDVHIRSSRLPYTSGLPGCRTPQVFLADVHLRSSRQTYTSGLPNWCTPQVFLANIHLRSFRLMYTSGLPGCRTSQVFLAAEKLHSHRSVDHRPEQMPAWGCPVSYSRVVTSVKHTRSPQDEHTLFQITHWGCGDTPTQLQQQK